MFYSTPLCIYYILIWTIKITAMTTQTMIQYFSYYNVIKFLYNLVYPSPSYHTYYVVNNKSSKGIFIITLLNIFNLRIWESSMPPLTFSWKLPPPLRTTDLYRYVSRKEEINGLGIPRFWTAAINHRKVYGR